MAQNDSHTLNMENRIDKYCREADENPIGEQQFSIYHVPFHIRKNNESYYEPRMVSIGPYHRGKEHLRAMQEYKWHYLGEYIKYSKGKKEDYIKQIREMKTSICACYFESFQLEEEPFVETMLLDSCFIIQLFIKWSYNEADPVQNIGWALPILMADLVMIENQIPFFVLQNMYNIYCYGTIVPPENLGDMRPSLIKLAVQSMNTIHNRHKQQDSNLPVATADIKHLLHLYYIIDYPEPEIITSRVSNSERVPTNCSNIVQLLVCNLPGVCGSKDLEKKESTRMIPSAKVLQEFGVKFKKKKKFKSILDISFKNGVLEMPEIILEEFGRSMSINLMAFEQCIPISTDRKHLTSYAMFMHCLINTSEDVIVECNPSQQLTHQGA